MSDDEKTSAGCSRDDADDWWVMFYLRQAAGGCQCSYHQGRKWGLRTGLAIMRLRRARECED